MDYIFLKTAFLTMFVAIDPPGLAPVFLTLTNGMDAKDRKSVAYRSVVIAFSILAAAAFGGKGLLDLLGISLPAFRIAGGLLLFSIAVEMVFEKREQRKAQSAEEVIAHHPRDVAAFPLAIPMMAGPGAITATILLASNAHGSYVNIAVLIAILIIVVGSCLPVFLMATKIDRFLGVSGRAILSRLLGVLLAAMAVQSIGDGVLAFIAK